MGKKRRLGRIDGMVNINLRKVTRELRAELKRIASERGITMELMCVEWLRNEVDRATAVRAGGRSLSGGSSILGAVTRFRKSLRWT